MQNAKNEAKKTVWQFIKFSAVGVTNTLVDFIVFWLLTHAGMNYMLSQVFSSLVPQSVRRTFSMRSS